MTSWDIVRNALRVWFSPSKGGEERRRVCRLKGLWERGMSWGRFRVILRARAFALGTFVRNKHPIGGWILLDLVRCDSVVICIRHRKAEIFQGL